MTDGIDLNVFDMTDRRVLITGAAGGIEHLFGVMFLEQVENGLIELLGSLFVDGVIVLCLEVIVAGRRACVGGHELFLLPLVRCNRRT